MRLLRRLFAQRMHEQDLQRQAVEAAEAAARRAAAMQVQVLMHAPFLPAASRHSASARQKPDSAQPVLCRHGRSKFIRLHASVCLHSQQKTMSVAHLVCAPNGR